MDARASQTHGPRRRIVVAALVLAAVGLLIAVAVGVAWRRESVAWLLRERARAMGLEDVSFRVGRVGANGFDLQDVRVGGGVRIAAVDVRFGPASLARGRLAALSIEGARISARVSAEGLEIPALAALRRDGDGSGGALVPPALPASRLRVEEARLEVETRSGPLRMDLDARIDTSLSGASDGDADLRFQHELGSGELLLHAEGGPDDLRGELIVRATADGELLPGWQLAGATVSADLEWRLADRELRVDADGCVQLGVESLRAPGGFVLNAPVSWCGGPSSDALLRLSEDATGGLAFEADLALPEASLDARVEDGETPLRVVGVAPQLGVRVWTSDADESVVEFTSAEGRFVVSPWELETRGFAVRLQRGGGIPPSGALRLESISDLRFPERFVPLSVALDLVPEGEAVAFSGSLGDADGVLRVEANGTMDADAGAGMASLALAPLEFVPSGLQPGSLSPRLGDSLTSASGRLEGAGEVVWGPDGTSIDATLGVHAVDASGTFGVVEGLEAALVVTGPWPPVSPSPQEISVARIQTAGAEFSDGVVNYRVAEGGALVVESARWNFAGGRIRSAGTLNAQGVDDHLVLRVDGVDLDQLLKFASLEGLEGDGSLSGRLPLMRVGDRVEIRAGELHSTRPGWIRYRDAETLSQAGGAGSFHFGATMDALRDFPYKAMKLTLTGDTRGLVDLEIRLEGSHQDPEVFGGHPINLNLNVQAELSDLVNTGMNVVLLPYEIERRILERQQDGP
jgi:hypothetical protein